MSLGGATGTPGAPMLGLLARRLHTKRPTLAVTVDGQAGSRPASGATLTTAGPFFLDFDGMEAVLARSLTTEGL